MLVRVSIVTCEVVNAVVCSFISMRYLLKQDFSEDWRRIQNVVSTLQMSEASTKTHCSCRSLRRAVCTLIPRFRLSVDISLAASSPYRKKERKKERKKGSVIRKKKGISHVGLAEVKWTAHKNYGEKKQQ